MTKVKWTKFSSKLIWKNFPLIQYVMIHKTIYTYYLNKPYNSLNLIMKLWIIFSTRYLMYLEKSFQSGIFLRKLEHHLGKYYHRSMVLEEERSDRSKKKRKEKKRVAGIGSETKIGSSRPNCIGLNVMNRGTNYKIIGYYNSAYAAIYPIYQE